MNEIKKTSTIDLMYRAYNALSVTSGRLDVHQQDRLYLQNVNNRIKQIIKNLESEKEKLEDGLIAQERREGMNHICTDHKPQQHF